jgi:hypothetical protein
VIGLSKVTAVQTLGGLANWKKWCQIFSILETAKPL